MNALDSILKNASRARLIPTVADSSKEERIVSILLATLSVTRALAEQVLSCAVRVKKTSQLSSYTEVEFPASGNNGKERPDGILILSTRNGQWTALLEAKTGNAKIDEDQMLRYAGIAREYGIDAIITLSNQLVSLPTHIPYSIPKRFTKSCQFFHLSWISILTQASLILRDREELVPEQAYVLGEMVRFFEHPNSGIKRFDQMNPEWQPLILGIREGQQYSRASPEIENTIASWHQEERDICLILSRRMGKHIGINLPRKHQNDPSIRLRDASDSLATLQELYSSFYIPNAASNLDVTVNLQRRTISCSMALKAPEDKQRTSARINWLIRQLKNVDGSDVIIRAFWLRGRKSTQAKLSEIRDNPKCLENGGAGAVLKKFEVVIVTDLAGRFSRRKTFIEDLEKVVPEFYERIGQHLRPWIPPPPAIEKRDPVQSKDDASPSKKSDPHSSARPTTSLSEDSNDSNGKKPTIPSKSVKPWQI
ncbi:MAG: hypothetical protein OXC38_03295 [Gammaproteobacteria bacterium]|nr:hypothetical protein [Gammaproteobacteria bacterium]